MVPHASKTGGTEVNSLPTPNFRQEDNLEYANMLFIVLKDVSGHLGTNLLSEGLLKLFGH